MLSLPTNIVGPLINSYLTERPSGLRVCGIPCPGPKQLRWMHKSTLFPFKERWFCQCDGNGFCAVSSDLGRFRTLRCTCPQLCLDKPCAKWNENAWTVLTVLRLSDTGSGKAYFASPGCNFLHPTHAQIILESIYILESLAE